MGYRGYVMDMLDELKEDLDTLSEEVETMLDMNDIEDIKIALSEHGQTIETLKRSMRE